MVGREPAVVYYRAAAADNAAQSLGQILGQFDALLNVLAYAAANGNYEVRADKVNYLLGSLNDFHNLGMHILRSQLDFGTDDFHRVGLRLVELGPAHNAGAHGCHSGTETGAYDGCHKVTAERRTCHLQVAVLHIELHVVDIKGGAGAQEVKVLGYINVQMRAVRAKASVQPCRAAGAKVAADGACADKEYLGLKLLYRVAYHLGVSIGGVIFKKRGFAKDYLVRAVAGKLLAKALYIVAKQQTAELNAQLVRKLTAFRDKLEIGGHQFAFALLAEYPNVLKGG